jgi:hypothetical protein
MRPAEDIEKLIEQKKVHLSTSSEMDKQILEDSFAAMDETMNAKVTAKRKNLWRIIVESKMTKFAAAAMIIIAVALSLTFLDKSVTAAYAIEQTIEAYNSIRWLYINEFYAFSFGEPRTSEIWLGCDEHGNVTRMRFQSDNVGEPVGSLIIAGGFGSSEAWLAKHNLHLVGYGNPSVLLRYDVYELDPKFLFQRLFEQESRGEVIVDVNEPMDKAEPIIVTVKYPQNSRSEKWKKVIYINQATKLVVKIDKYERRDHEYEHVKTFKFADYNQPIDPMMFTVDGDVSADAKVVDMTDVEAGLLQDDMTDEEVANEITKQFFEAAIARDFYRAGQLYLAAPDFLVEQAFTGANVLEIISVGPAHPDPDPDSDAMICSCKFLTESGGQYYEVNAWMVKVIKVDEDTNDWLICGMAINVNPSQGRLTLSTEGADLSAVTYQGLLPGEMMQKWLLLEPIRIEVRGDTFFPSEETQEDEFRAAQIDSAQFEPEVIIGEQNYRWSVLENEYGTINLTSEYEDWYLITYLWAQVDMSDKKPGVLGIGSDDSVKVWLNGELVHENWIVRGVGIDNDHVPVIFKKGINQLVIKIQNRGGPWGFCCRLVDE